MANRDFEQFFASLQFDDSPHFSPERVASLLGVKRKDLAELCGIRAAKLRLSPTSADLQRSLRDIGRIFGAAYGRFENENQLVFWFKNCPIEPCGFRTPAEMLAQGRASEVIDCLLQGRC